MTQIRIGPTAIKGVYLGATEAKSVYLGSTLIWTPPPTGPSFDAAANGGTGQARLGSIPFSDTAAPDADVFVAAMTTAYSTTSAVTAKYGSTPMSAYSVIALDNNSNDGYLFVFRLAKGGTGSAVTVTVTDTGGSGALVACAASYSNVTTVGTAVTAYGSGTALSITVPSAANHRPVCVFGANANSTSKFNQSLRAIEATLSIGDAPGASSVTFSETISPSAGWAAIGFDLS